MGCHRLLCIETFCIFFASFTWVYPEGNKLVRKFCVIEWAPSCKSGPQGSSFSLTKANFRTPWDWLHRSPPPFPIIKEYLDLFTFLFILHSALHLGSARELSPNALRLLFYVINLILSYVSFLGEVRKIVTEIIFCVLWFR